MVAENLSAEEKIMNKSDRIKKNNRREIISAAFSLLLTALSVAVFFSIYLRHYRYATRYAIRGNYLLLLMYTFLLVLFLSLYGGYRLRQTRTRELLFSYALSAFLADGILFTVMCLIARRILPMGDILLVLAVQCVVAVLLYIAGRILVPRFEPSISTLYIRPEAEKERDISAKFDERRTSYVVSAVAEDGIPRRELLEAIEPHEAVILGEVSSQTRQFVVGYCYRTGRKVLLIPNMTDIMVGSAQPLLMGDFLLYDLNTQGGKVVYRAAKRGWDILVSSVGLIVLSPLMLLTALAVKLQDGGPVFYRQIRLTKGGREFQLTKFRSMIPHAEDGTGAVLSTKGDSRITRVGKFIRATRLDELPQLWNILRGDMSLVGPRPERPEFYESICSEYPEFNYRLMVTAGLTGYAQLYGKYNTSFADKARLDMYYIQHASFLWDLQLLLYTLKIIFIKESTEGIEGPEQGAENGSESMSEEEKELVTR